MYVLTTEFVGPKHRNIAGTLVWMFYTSSLIVLSGLAYGIRNWRNLSIVISAPAFPLLLLWWSVLTIVLNTISLFISSVPTLPLLMLSTASMIPSGIRYYNLTGIFFYDVQGGSQNPADGCLSITK